jgi:hypothetical protein
MHTDKMVSKSTILQSCDSLNNQTKCHLTRSSTSGNNISDADAEAETSPYLGFPALNLAAPMAEYTYGRSYTTGSPGRPFAPPHSVYPAALMSLCAGTDSTSGHTSRGSGSHLPNLSSVPCSVCYNPIHGALRLYPQANPYLWYPQ